MSEADSSASWNSSFRLVLILTVSAIVVLAIKGFRGAASPADSSPAELAATSSDTTPPVAAHKPAAPFRNNVEPAVPEVAALPEGWFYKSLHGFRVPFPAEPEMQEIPLPQMQSQVIGVGISEAMSFTKVACGFDFIEYRNPEIDLKESLKWLTYGYEKKMNSSDVSISSEPGEMFGNPCLTAKVLCKQDNISVEYH